METGDISRIEKSFPPDEFYCPPTEVNGAELQRPQRGHFNLIHHASGFKADIYLSGTDPLHTWALAGARKVTIGHDEISFAPPEYVILRKLQFCQEGRSTKHLRDIHRMLLVLGHDLDRDSLDRRITEYGLTDEWTTARNYSEE